MAVVLCSNKFACKLVAHKCARMYICGRGWRYFVDSPNAVVFLLKQKARNFLKISCKRLTEGLFRTATDGGGSMQQRFFAKQKLAASECTRRYIRWRVYLRSRAKWMPETSSWGTPSGKEISVAFIESAMA